MDKAVIKILLSVLIGISIACAGKEKTTIYEDLATSFFTVYQDKNDFDKFMNYYEEDAELQDMMNGDKIVGKEKIRTFFAWNHPDYVKLHNKTLVVEEQMVDGHVVVTKGHFKPFKWGDLEVEAMQFMTTLYFSENGKIQKQIDWINYPASLVNYEKRKNSNDWLLEQQE